MQSPLFVNLTFEKNGQTLRNPFRGRMQIKPLSGFNYFLLLTLSQLLFQLGENEDSYMFEPLSYMIHFQLKSRVGATGGQTNVFRKFK